MSQWRTVPFAVEATGPDGRARRVLQEATGPLNYFPVNPFRVVASSQDESDKLHAPIRVSGPVWADTTGSMQVPSDVKAVTFNVTITQTVGAGYLAVIPANAPFSDVSTINWTADGVDRANNGTVAVGPRGIDGLVGCISIVCPVPFSGTHYIIDITGYYR